MLQPERRRLERVIDLEGETRWLLERAGYTLEDIPPVRALARRLGITLRRSDRPKCGAVSCTAKLYGEPWIFVWRRLPESEFRFAVCHEIAHTHLDVIGYRDEDVELAADALGAALAMPRLAFRGAVAEYGETSYEQLAFDFGVTQTAAALRVGEVIDTPIAVVTPGRVRVRGAEWGWPHEPMLRQIAQRPSIPGLRKTQFTDDRRRLALSADACTDAA